MTTTLNEHYARTYSVLFTLIGICTTAQYFSLTTYDKTCCQHILLSQVLNTCTSPKRPSSFLVPPNIYLSNSFLLRANKKTCLTPSLVQHRLSVNNADTCGRWLQLVFPSVAATQNFLQIIPEFLPTDAVKEEIYPTVWRIKLSSNFWKQHRLRILKGGISLSKNQVNKPEISGTK